MQLHLAYNLTIEKILELQASGIQVETQKPFKEANIKHTATYEKTGELPKALWNYVTFVHLTEEQMQQLLATRISLTNCGIWFDSGAIIGDGRPSPDWQLDYSFIPELSNEPHEVVFYTIS